MQDSESLESCNICMEFYNDVVRPRCLPCGHNMCVACIRKATTAGGLSCPQCQKTFSTLTVYDIPINYGMEALIVEVRKLKQGATPKQQLGSERIDSRSKSSWQAVLIDQVNSLKCLIQNGEEKETDLLIYKAFVHQRKEDHKKHLQKIADIVSQHHEIIKLLDYEEEQVSNQVSCGRKYLETAASELNKCDSTEREDIVAACDRIIKNCQTLEELNSKTAEHLPNVETIRNSEKLLRQTTAALVAVNSEQDNPRPAPHARSYSSMPLMDVIKLISREPMMSLSTLLSMTQSTKDLLKKGHLYTVQNKQGRIRSGRISYVGDQLYLHHLKDEEPPIYARTIMHSDLIGILNQESVLTFMDLARNGSILGRLYILLSPDTPLARHFRILCTGDLGVTYAQSRFLSRSGMNVSDLVTSNIAGGDYENNDGSGGTPLMDGLNPGDVIYSRALKSGNIHTMFHDAYGSKIAQFQITYNVRNHPVRPVSLFSAIRGTSSQPMQSGVFGQVQHGLEILAAAETDIDQVIVEDCGIVVSLKGFS